MPWLIFAILSPALSGISNFIDKFLVDKKIKDLMLVTIFTGILAFVTGVIILAIKHFPIITVGPLVLLLFSGILLDLYLIPYFSALSKEETSRVIPLFQFVPIFVLVLSAIFLKEVLSFNQLLAFVFIIIGGFIICVDKFDMSIFKPRRSFWQMMFSSFLYSITSIMFKFVILRENFWVSFGYESIGIGMGAMILLVIPHIRISFDREVSKAKPTIWELLIATDFLGVLGQFFTSYAFLLAPVALVSVIGGLQPLFVIIYGLILSIWLPKIIKEDISKKAIELKFLSTILILIGIYLIYV